MKVPAVQQVRAVLPPPAYTSSRQDVPSTALKASSLEPFVFRDLPSTPQAALCAPLCPSGDLCGQCSDCPQRSIAPRRQKMRRLCPPSARSRLFSPWQGHTPALRRAGKPPSSSECCFEHKTLKVQPDKRVHPLAHGSIVRGVGLKPCFAATRPRQAASARSAVSGGFSKSAASRTVSPPRESARQSAPPSSV